MNLALLIKHLNVSVDKVVNPVKETEKRKKVKEIGLARYRKVL